MIRKLNEKDENTIKDLLCYFPKETQKNLHFELEQAIVNLVYGFVYVENNEIVGYIILRKFGGVYHIDTLVVNSSFQHKGIGKYLVEFAKEKCIKENIPQLNVCTFNKKNMLFYKKLGFVLMGKLKGPFIPLEKTRFYFKWLNN